MNNKLYLISPTQINNINNFLLILEKIFSRFHNYIFAFQLRIKGDSSSIFNLGKKINDLCRNYGISFMLNDYLDIALKINDGCGIHLGQKDLIKFKTKIHSDIKLGISCHDSIELALKAIKFGANYVSFGAFFPSKTKSITTGKPKLTTLRQWLKLKNNIPTVVIGGINTENCTQFIEFPEVIIALSYFIWFHRHGPLFSIKELLSK
ncbi:MAG: thiamine phosphate synthase [Rickettsiaceae bacterium H1]|nr:thiamine phosphate synthase [Rickettsiaceae bacterium H1]